MFIFNKKKYKRFKIANWIFSFFLILNSFFSFVPYSYAQNTLDNSSMDASFSAILVNPPSLASDSASNFPQFTLDGMQNLSNANLKIKPPVFVESLSKSNYQVKEKVELVVKNSENINLELQVEGKDFRGNIQKTNVNGDTVFSIYPSSDLRPGKYSLKVINKDTNEVIQTQDFTWGVLAINTNKSIYLPNETAKIAIAVLDEDGQMVCDAVVSLEIESPTWKKTVLSTTNGGIVVNRECLVRDITEKPDYEATFPTDAVGRYQMTLTATTIKGTYSVKDRFEVREFVPFDVERQTATRIYPPEAYPVAMKIKANQGFKGKIVETVPQEFQIIEGPEGSISYSQESIIPQSYDPRKETGIPSLRLPFNGEYPVTLGFGDNIDGHGMEDRYKKYGIDGHDGIDFALPEGTPVVSVDIGKVILAQKNWIYGTSVVIEHSWGRSYYGHLSELKVVAGNIVSAGQEIGLSGKTGLVTGAHLHFGLKPNNNDINNLYFGKIDPAPFFGIASEDPSLSVSNYPIAAKAIIWNVDIEKGAEFTIGYKYRAPYTSPYFYTIGPLQFITSDIPESKAAKFDSPFVLGEATPSADLNSSFSAELSPALNQQKEQVIFKEIRPWQIAADRTNAIILDANADGTCGSGCWTVPSDWTNNNTITAIGGGGAGDNTSATTGQGGGGGGSYSRIENTTSLTPSTNVGFSVGAGGTDGVQAGDTWFCSTTTLCTGIATGNVIVSADRGVTATSITGGTGGTTTAGIGTFEFAGGAGGTGNATGADSAGGGGGAGSPNGTGGAGGVGDSVSAGEENSGGGGGSGCDAIGASNNGSMGTGTAGGLGGSSCFVSGGSGGDGTTASNPGSRGSGGGGGDEGAGIGETGGVGGDGLMSDDPSLSGGGGGGGDDDGGVGAAGGYYGGGGGGGATVGVGRGGVVVITYTVKGPFDVNPSLAMRHGKWFDPTTNTEAPFTF